MRLAPERSPPGQQLVEDHAQAEDVRAAIDPVPFAPGLLGTHVGGRPGEPRTLAEVLVLQGQPEVGHERLARGVDQDVGRLDVPMDQPSGVGVVQGLGDRRHQFRRLPEGQVEPALILTARSLPSMNFETTKQRPSSVRPTSIDRDDVGVVEAGEDAGFGQVRLDVLRGERPARGSAP